MTTNRQKSFIATLTLDQRHLNVLGALYENPVLRYDNSFSGGFYTGAPKTIDDAIYWVAAPKGK